VGRSLACETLGLEYGRVRLVDHDEVWVNAFERESDRLHATLGTLALAVEHVGSTAVPGLISKPILDIAVGLGAVADHEVLIVRLELLGYSFRGDAGDGGGLVFVLEDRPAHRVAHVHAVRFGGDQWRRYLMVRDQLRTDQAARTAYAQLKRRLADRFADDRRFYTAAKSPFIAWLVSGASAPAGRKAT
jgi:GrpB-like predicted nucleotidyltransferase (UPF0157 family)